VSCQSVPRIFIVDDEHVIASTLAAILNMNGYSARCFTRPLEALIAAPSDTPDLLISDVAMPGFSGIDLAIQMRAQHPKCKMLLFSGQAAMLDLLEDARNQGHDFHLLAKPIHPTEVLSEIGTLGLGEHSLETVGQPQYPAPMKQALTIRDALPVDGPAEMPAKGMDGFTPEQVQRLTEYLPIVRVVARRISKLVSEQVSFGDLYGAGVAGLIGALCKFDFCDQSQFLSDARFRIREAILDSLRGLVWSAEELRRKGRPIEEAIHTLTAELERSPTELEISRELSVDLPAYHRLLDELKGIEIGTLHTQRSKESGEEEVVNLPNQAEENPQSRFQRAELQRRLADAINDLPERERLVVTLSYYEGLTLKRIGFVLDEVESRVSQIHASAILRLRSRLSDFGYS
jgi:RNA polymerase sigma factor for flagellar operon FliA